MLDHFTIFDDLSKREYASGIRENGPCHVTSSFHVICPVKGPFRQEIWGHFRVSDAVVMFLLCLFET